MNIKHLFIIVVSLVVLLNFSAISFCEFPPHNNIDKQEFEKQAKEKFNKMAEKLGLTQDQISQMNEIREQNISKTKEIISQIRQKDKAIDEELLKENYDRVVVNSLLQEIRQLSADMAQLRIDDKIKVRSILTQNQFLKIEQEKKEFLSKVKPHKKINKQEK